MSVEALASTETAEVLYDVENRVATITLNRPDKLNAWTPTMAEQLRAAFMRAQGDEKVRAIVLTGAGRGFCAGADMSGLAARASGQGVMQPKHDVPTEGLAANFAQRNRQRGPPRHLQNFKAVGKARARAAMLLGHPGKRQAGLGQRVPQRPAPAVILRVIDGLGIGQIGKNARRRIGDDMPALVHAVTLPCKAPCPIAIHAVNLSPRAVRPGRKQEQGIAS